MKKENRKAYKYRTAKNISSLRAVSMIPSDSKELLDDLFNALSPRRYPSGYAGFYIPLFLGGML